jgi:hypothetical protein
MAAIEQEALWVSGEGEYHTYRIPALERTVACALRPYDWCVF